MPKNISVTQADIDACDPESSDNNCIAVALKRLRRRQDIRAFAYLGYVRIGKRKYELDQWPCNRLIIHSAGYTIQPFEFQLPATYATGIRLIG